MKKNTQHKGSSMEEPKREKIDLDRDADDDDSDDNDELLAAAAAQWAASKEQQQQQQQQQQQPQCQDDDKQPLPTTAQPLVSQEHSASAPQQHSYNTNPTNRFSLHVTQLSFDATDYDIRSAFVKHGCAVRSIRLVYDHDGGSNHNGARQKTFRGVAFVDVDDQDSYDKALKLLDRSYLLGRRINVRPTRTREELANIVQKSRVLVAEKIRKGREREEQEASSDSHGPTASSKKGRRQQERLMHNEATTRQDRPGTKRRKRSQEYTKEHNSSRDNKQQPRYDHGDRKLTKKERNRRAAIILQRNKRRRK